MGFPSFYDPAKVGTLFTPRMQAVVQEAIAATLPEASSDEQRTLLLLVDPQVDFIHTDGALSVPGAVEDTRRTIEWIFRHAGRISQIVTSLDSHIPQQIFSPSWWVNQAGESPAPFTVITSEDVQSGRWIPVFEAEWSERYVAQLEETAKKLLMIWPYHTLIGTIGHSVTPALYEAIAYHAAARKIQPQFVVKGTNPLVEHYSIFEPEVKIPEQENAGRNHALLEHIGSFDRIFIAGQAKSHCVLESVTSIMRYFADHQEIINKVSILTDAMSSVISPGIDFDQIANETYAAYANDGLKRCTTQDAL